MQSLSMGTTILSEFSLPAEHRDCRCPSPHQNCLIDGSVEDAIRVAAFLSVEVHMKGCQGTV